MESGFKMHCASVRRKFHRIAAQILQHVDELVEIASHERHVRSNLTCELQMLLSRQGPYRGAHDTHHIADVYHLKAQFHAAGIKTAHLQNVVDHQHERLGVGLDARQGLSLVLVGSCAMLAQQIGKGHDGSERCAQLMAHHREEVTLVLVLIHQLSVDRFQLATLLLEHLVSLLQLSRPISHLVFKSCVNISKFVGHVVEGRRERTHLLGRFAIAETHVKIALGHFVHASANLTQRPCYQIGQRHIHRHQTHRQHDGEE